MIPTIRPKTAPTAIDGTKIPAGTLHPYERTIKNVRMMVASSKELTICHWVEDLTKTISNLQANYMSSWCHLLAKTGVVPSAFTFLEQDFQTLRHIDSQETVKVTYHC